MWIWPVNESSTSSCSQGHWTLSWVHICAGLRYLHLIGSTWDTTGHRSKCYAFMTIFGQSFPISLSCPAWSSQWIFHILHHVTYDFCEKHVSYPAFDHIFWVFSLLNIVFFQYDHASLKWYKVHQGLMQKHLLSVTFRITSRIHFISFLVLNSHHIQSSTLIPFITSVLFCPSFIPITLGKVLHTCLSLHHTKGPPLRLLKPLMRGNKRGPLYSIEGDSRLTAPNETFHSFVYDYRTTMPCWDLILVIY